jgi:hypothetical protein
VPRLARPRYHKKRRRWYAYIGKFARDGRRHEVYAPESVQREADAWAWFVEQKARRGIE